MIRQILFTGAAALAAGWCIGGCFNNTDLKCPPGMQVSCDCLGGSTGVQVCDEEGSSYGVCMGCSEVDQCTPGLLRNCDCPDGETVGIQECADDGNWGACEECGASDGDADTDSDGDTDSDADGDSCIGDICADVEECCESAECSSWVYSSSSYIENYCYPTCDVNGGSNTCEGDDVCVNYAGLGLCLGTGSLVFDQLTVPVGETSNDAQMVEASTVDFEAVHDGAALPIDLFVAYWSEYGGYRELSIWAQGKVPNKTGTDWILIIYIPEELYDLGPGEYPMLNDDETALNFDLALYTGVSDENNYIVEAWKESDADPYSTTLTINEICDACTSDSETCDPCSFSVDASWFALRGKLDLN